MRTPTTPEGLWYEVAPYPGGYRVTCRPHGQWLGDVRSGEQIANLIRPFELADLFSVADVIELDSRRRCDTNSLSA